MRLIEAQGAGEQRTESYLITMKGVAEPATQRFIKSDGIASGFARRQVIAARGDD